MATQSPNLSVTPSSVKISGASYRLIKYDKLVKAKEKASVKGEARSKSFLHSMSFRRHWPGSAAG